MVPTVLIIDGEPAQRDILTRSLQNRLGYHTLACASVREAASCFGADSSLPNPDLILFDWVSAGGSDAVATLREFSAHVPLAVLVKYGDYDAGIAALNAGAQDFLTKPVAMERISTTFRNLLLLRDACREVEWLRSETRLPARTDKAAFSLPPLALLDEDGNIRRMEDIQAETIRFAMQYYHGRMTEVAKRLGIGRSTLYRKLSGLGTRQVEAAA